VGARRRGATVVAVGLAVVVLGSGAGLTLARLTTSTTLGSNAFTAAASFDTVAPTVSATVISKSTPYFASYVKQAGTYYVYANATDGGAVPSGTATIKADVSAITTGSTAISLTAGVYSPVQGVTYGWRSALLTASNPITAGAKTYTLTSTDFNGNSRLQTAFPVTVDNTAPAASDIQTANGGATVGRIERGDTITFTFNDVIDPESILTGWTGASTSVVVRFTNVANSDTYAVYDGTNTTLLKLGSVNTKGNYVTAATTAGVGATPSTMVLDTATNKITITLGTIAGTVATDAANRTAAWTPVATAFDRAANAMSATLVNEGVPADPDF